MPIEKWIPISFVDLSLLPPAILTFLSKNSLLVVIYADEETERERGILDFIRKEGNSFVLGLRSCIKNKKVMGGNDDNDSEKDEVVINSESKTLLGLPIPV